MKVITEERLADIFATRFINEETQQLLIHECQELDTLTVTRLRPMSDAPKSDEITEESVTVLAMHKETRQFIPVIVFNDGDVCSSYEGFTIDEFFGFIPMPRYEPEKV